VLFRSKRAATAASWLLGYTPFVITLYAREHSSPYLQLYAMSVGMTSANPVKIDGSALDGGAMIVQPDQGVSAIKRNQEMTVGLLPPGKSLHCVNQICTQGDASGVFRAYLPCMACDTSVARSHARSSNVGADRAIKQ
jgi:hypothetical protein